MIVVISQSATNQPQLRDYEEQLVAYLLLEARCEVNLIPDLNILDQDSTGLLCLEGIKGDMALLSWNEPAGAHALLESHGIHGRLGGAPFSAKPEALPPEELGPGVYDAMQRSVHHLQLDLQYSGKHYEAHIKGLTRDSAIKTVSLDGLPAPSTAGVANDPHEALEPTVAGPVESESSAPSVAPVPKRSSLYQEDEPDDGELDALIDRLDESDL